MEEQFKKIKDFDYLVGNKGTIKNLKGKEICQWIDNVGYKQVNLFKNGKRYYKRVHRLVAEAFIPNDNNLPQVNHIDGDKTNNTVQNLEWTYYFLDKTNIKIMNDTHIHHSWD